MGHTIYEVMAIPRNLLFAVFPALSVFDNDHHRSRVFIRLRVFLQPGRYLAPVVEIETNMVKLALLPNSAVTMVRPWRTKASTAASPADSLVASGRLQYRNR